MLRRAAACLLAALLAAACVGELLTVVVEESGSTVVKGAGVLGGVLGALEIGGLDDLSVSVNQELANQGVAPGDIASASLTDFVLSTPDGEDLAFLASVTFRIASPGLDAVVIAHAVHFPAGEPVVPLTIEPVDLMPYMVAEAVTITTEVTGELPVDDTTIVADLTLTFEATVQGACNQAERAAE